MEKAAAFTVVASLEAELKKSKSPIRCKVSPYFAKKFRLNYFLPLKAIIYGFSLPAFANVGQLEAKPISFSE